MSRNSKPRTAAELAGLQLAAMADIAVMAPGTLIPPDHVEVSNGELICATDFLAPRQKHSAPKTLIWDFIQLETATDETIAKFARTHAALGICYGHGQPDGHSPGRTIADLIALSGAAQAHAPTVECAYQIEGQPEIIDGEGRFVHRERCAHWREWAQRFRVLHHVATTYAMEQEPDRRDLQFLQKELRREVEPEQVIGLVLNEWLRQTTSRPRVTPKGNSFEIWIGGERSHALPELILQLTQVLGKERSAASRVTPISRVCLDPECRQRYDYLRKRKPGLEGLCPKCSRKQSNRAYQRRRRQNTNTKHGARRKP